MKELKSQKNLRVLISLPSCLGSGTTHKGIRKCGNGAMGLVLDYFPDLEWISILYVWISNEILGRIGRTGSGECHEKGGEKKPVRNGFGYDENARVETWRNVGNPRKSY